MARKAALASVIPFGLQTVFADSLQVRRKTAEIAVKGPDLRLIFFTVADQGPPG